MLCGRSNSSFKKYCVWIKWLYLCDYKRCQLLMQCKQDLSMSMERVLLQVKGRIYHRRNAPQFMWSEWSICWLNISAQHQIWWRKQCANLYSDMLPTMRSQIICYRRHVRRGRMQCLAIRFSTFNTVSWPPTFLWARVRSSTAVFRSWSGPHNRVLERAKTGGETRQYLPA